MCSIFSNIPQPRNGSRYPCSLTPEPKPREDQVTEVTNPIPTFLTKPALPLLPTEGGPTPPPAPLPTKCPPNIPTVTDTDSTELMCRTTSSRLLHSLTSVNKFVVVVVDAVGGIVVVIIGVDVCIGLVS